MKLIIPFLVLFISSFSFAQSDSVRYVPGFKFNEGIYLDYRSFKANKPVAKAQIIADYSKEELDFVRKIIAKRFITYLDTLGRITEVNAQSLWGFSENNSIYIRYNDDFNKIVVLGGLCHFTALFTTYFSSSPTMGVGQTTGTPVESIQQYILDIQTGQVFDYVLPNMEELLKRDANLYIEFMAFSKRKRRQMMFIYLRKYNERQGLYLGLPSK